jgi:sugar (pentulose or hexulose) kinase
VILAVDVGTSALKAVLYDRAGQVTAQASRRYGYTTPQPGWAEADPESVVGAFDAPCSSWRNGLSWPPCA